MRILFSFFIFTFHFAATAQIPSYVPTNGLVGWWPFNGNANDESGNGNNGVVNGASLTVDRFDNVNKAISFDVGNFIVVPQSNTLNNLGNATISLWLKTNYQGQAVIIKKGNFVNATGEQLSIDMNSTQYWRGGAKYNSNCVPGAGWNLIDANQSINDNVWHMITLVISNSVLKLYKDSICLNQISIPNTTIDNCLSEINFGRNWSGNNDYYKGILDDIAIYNRALSPQEISQLYTSAITTSTTEDTTSNVGIGTTTPKRKLHVNDVMRLEPRNTAPANPGEGDIYYDATLKKLRYYNGTGWISL